MNTETGLGLSTQLLQIENICKVINLYSYSYSNEIQFQDGLEKAFERNNIKFEREVRLSPADIVDFILPYSGGSIAVEVKIGGSRNALLRQIGRYLEHESITCVLVVGTPYWVLNLPQELNKKPIYCLRVMSGFFR